MPELTDSDRILLRIAPGTRLGVTAEALVALAKPMDREAARLFGRGWTAGIRNWGGYEGGLEIVAVPPAPKETPR